MNHSTSFDNYGMRTEVSIQHFTMQNSSISDDNLQEISDTKLAQLRQLFETRYYQPRPWPKVFPGAELDCEGLAHYLMKGKVGKFEETETPAISQVDLKKEHRPYTCYKIWQPRSPWSRKALGFWGGVHYFTHLENGQYISKTGIYAIRIFDSFEDMLIKDGFPSGFVTEDYKDTKDIEKAIMGESMVGTIH